MEELHALARESMEQIRVQSKLLKEQSDRSERKDEHNTVLTEQAA